MRDERQRESVKSPTPFDHPPHTHSQMPAQPACPAHLPRLSVLAPTVKVFAFPEKMVSQKEKCMRWKVLGEIERVYINGAVKNAQNATSTNACPCARKANKCLLHAAGHAGRWWVGKREIRCPPQQEAEGRGKAPEHHRPP